jgi:hypothetical protein
MSDDFKLQQDANRGAKAAALLQNELLNEAYEEIEAALIQKWKSSEPDDTDGRELTWHMLRANTRHKQLLQSHISNGKVAQAELNKLHAEASRKQRYGVI